jgi:hypothetical protein
MPWIWWPGSQPRRDRPYRPEHHAAYLAWSAASFAFAEALSRRLPEEMRSTGARLRSERAISAVTSVVLWIVCAGAWDRRAERLRRRPWSRLTA